MNAYREPLLEGVLEGLGMGAVTIVADDQCNQTFEESMGRVAYLSPFLVAGWPSRYIWLPRLPCRAADRRRDAACGAMGDIRKTRIMMRDIRLRWPWRLEPASSMWGSHVEHCLKKHWVTNGSELLSHGTPLRVSSPQPKSHSREVQVSLMKAYLCLGKGPAGVVRLLLPRERARSVSTPSTSKVPPI